MKNNLDGIQNISMENFDYPLPDERIAKFPQTDRDKSKLLLYNNGEITHSVFSDVANLDLRDDLLIFNNTKVIHARLFFRKPTGALIEVFCLEPYLPEDYASNFAQRKSCQWRCLVGNLKKWHEGIVSATYQLAGVNEVIVANKVSQLPNGEVIIDFSWGGDISFAELLEMCGKIPIPPYLNRESEQSDNLRYQTVYSKSEGSVAAPTAGLHFTKQIINTLQESGVNIGEVTLHVGAGTFKPVKSETIGGHEMHTEHIIIPKSVVEQLLACKRDIIGVGTTSVRTLESLYWMGVKLIMGVDEFNSVKQWEVYELLQNVSLKDSMTALLNWFNDNHEDTLKAATTIIIVPGYKYRVIDYMFTNFHQPHSTLLLLVSAAIGEDWHKVYSYALEHDFRFLSYGDSSLLKVQK